MTARTASTRTVIQVSRDVFVIVSTVEGNCGWETSHWVWNDHRSSFPEHVASCSSQVESIQQHADAVTAIMQEI